MGSNPIARSAAIAQLVERVLGKDEVPGSNPGGSLKGTVDDASRPLFFSPSANALRSFGPGRPQPHFESANDAFGWFSGMTEN